MDRQILALYTISVYWMPCPLNVLSHLFLTILGCTYCFHSHLTDEETEACRLLLVRDHNLERKS